MPAESSALVEVSFQRQGPAGAGFVKSLGVYRRFSVIYFPRRRWGLKLSERGGKNAKKRAVVAVARKLSVLLHKLWMSGEVYEPLRNHRAIVGAVA